MVVLEVIAAVLLPPLGIFLRAGIGPAFWVGLVLTLIAWLPGVLFALVVLLKPDLLPADWLRPRLR